MALDSLAAALTVGLNWTAQKDITGSDYQPLTNATNISKKSTLGTSANNNALGGANELASFVQSISASSSATIDLTSLTNILQATGVSLARVKAVVIRLLSATDDSVIGTAASSITIGNNASNDWTSQSGTGWLGTATSTFVIPNGGVLAFATANAGGVLVDATHKIIKVANADASLAAKVQITLIGGTT